MPNLDKTAEGIMCPVEKRLGYKFRNSLLLAEALTHPSISFDRKDYAFDNQRLEFLGDSVVQIIITEHLYRIFPSYNEGQLTKIRTQLVSRGALCSLSLQLGLGEFLMLGRGEEVSGGRERASTLADAFESLVGAIYLDGGFNAARQFVLRETKNLFRDISSSSEESNPKGALQEILQAIKPSIPVYEITETVGPAHARQFSCDVTWDGRSLGHGVGSSKKEAQISAASDALSQRRWETAKIKRTKQTLS